MATQKKCGKCGFTVADNQNEVEVEYKDFKTLELLEIRQKKQTQSPGEEAKICTEQTGADVIKQEKAAAPLLEAKKSSFPNLMIVILILALIIGGLFLLRLLFQQ